MRKKERLKNCAKGREKTLITKVVASNKVTAIAPRATYEIFFNHLQRCVQKYQRASRLSKHPSIFLYYFMSLNGHF